MAELRLTSAGKTYENGVVAVEAVDLEIQDHEFVVLVGPSGCGKSTLLRMIAGLEEITTGTVEIDGELMNDRPPRDRDIAMVFQDYALYPHMNVFENMAMSLRLRKTPSAEIDRRVQEAARLLGIEALLQRRPAQLSGGQRQRVALGRTVVRRPKVFLFDEPLSNLDAKMRVEMRTELSRLHRDLGATMIYVTHDQTEAMTMGSRIVILESGKVQQIAAPLTLYDRPANRFVASFIGSPPMNFWPVRISLDGASQIHIGDQVVTLRGTIPQSLRELAGRDLLMGLRPEHLRPGGGEQDEGLVAPLSPRLDVLEPLGSETLLYWTLGAERGVARVYPSYMAEVGAPIELSALLSRAHFFDPESERTLLSWPED